MNVTYPGATNNIPRFTTLDKVVLTKNRDSLTLYYGSDTSLLDLDDFNEYGWEFLVKKYRYNSFCPLNLLTLRDKTEVIGYDSNCIENTNKCFFPTLIEVDEEDSDASDLIQYFGTLSVGRQKLTMIRIPPGYSDADIQDTTDESPSKIHILFQGDEIKYYKIIWFVLTPGEKNKIVDINLSYISWEISNNPFRNQDKYLLREDDRVNIIHGIDVVENIGTETNPHWLDQSSGTIVGNRAVTSTPILNQIIEMLEDNTSWDKYVSYKRGQTCTYNGENWISLENNNIGNNPKFSNLWSLESLFSKEFTISRAIVTTTNLSGEEVDDYGEVTPTTLIATTSIEEYELTLYCKNGYVPSRIRNVQTDKDIILYDEDGTSDYYWQAYTSGNGYCKVTIPTSFVEQADEINVEFRKADLECLSFSENISTGERVPISGDNSYRIVRIGDTYANTFNSGSGTIINEVILNYLIGDDVVVKTEVFIPDPDRDNPSEFRVEKIIDYPAEYHFICRYEDTDYFTINIIEHRGFFVDTMTRKVPRNSTDPVIINFYPENGDLENTQGTVEIGSVVEPISESSTIINNKVRLEKNNCYQLIFNNIAEDYNIKFNKNEN